MNPNEILESLQTCVLRTAPRVEADTLVDIEYSRRFAALASAYHRGEPVSVYWLRDRSEGPVTVGIGGPGLIANTAGEQQLTLSLPAGGQGTALPGTIALHNLARMPHWTRVTAVMDGLLSGNHRDGDCEPAPPSIEDCLLAVWDGPFAWLLIARPIPAEELAELRAMIADEERDAWRKRDQSPKAAIEADRLRIRHQELAAAASTGAWRMVMAAGGQTATDSRQIAGLLCAAADLRTLPYVLRPESNSMPLHKLGTQKHESTVVDSRMLAAVARPPNREIPGVRFVLPATFDTTPERSTEGRSVRLGTVLDRTRNNVDHIDLPLESLNRHTFVCGATGTGKSQTTRGLLEAATTEGIPWLVVEPAKAEYRAMAARLKDRASVIAIRPGQIDAIPAGINPLEPGIDSRGHRFPLQTHADMVRALFLASFQSEEPFPQVLSAALTRCYTELGWDLALGEPLNPAVEPRYPTLGDLQRVAEDVVTDIGYGKEITDNIRGFIKVRLSSLRMGTTGRFLEGGHPIDFSSLLRRNVVIEIEDVGDDKDKAFLMGTILIRLTEYLRLEQQSRHQPSEELRHLTVVEEAHRLLRDPKGEQGPAAAAVEMFAGLLAEIRAYGEGLIIAEQIPDKLIPDVIKNTAVKIVHRLPAEDDRTAVGATMNITGQQSRFIVTLDQGEAAVFTDGMDYPILTKMDNGKNRENMRDVTLTEATPLVSPRSATCRVDCAQQPCTLRQMRMAQRTLDLHPRLVVWAELAVVGHLTGYLTPMPLPALADEWKSIPDNTRDCALSHAVDAAVASRSTAISDRVSPARLARHLATVLREHMRTGKRHVAIEPEFLSTPYRWNPVKLRIDDRLRAGFHAPVTIRDERLMAGGRQIPGDSLHDQQTLLNAWMTADRRDKQSLTIIRYGRASASDLQRAVGVAPSSPEWSAALKDTLREFDTNDWPIELFPTESGRS